MSSATVDVASIVRSNESTVMPAASMADRTDDVAWGSHVTCHRSPSRVMSSAPASRAAIINSSSSTEPGTSTIPLRSNCQATAPGSASDPPSLENVERISAPVRLRLSVSASTYTATPLGA